MGRRDVGMVLWPITILGAVAGLWEILTTIPQPFGQILIGVAILWIAFSVGWIARKYRSIGETDRRVLEDADFLLKVLDAGMPPLFIKVWDPKENRGTHIWENQAFHKIQDATGTFEVDDDRGALIREDHRRGDLAALRCRSVQLEISDRQTGVSERHILTTKTCVKHRKKTYVVGWFVPVSLEGTPLKAPISDDKVSVREHGFQVMFRLVEATKNARLISVAEAVRTPPAPRDPAAP